MELTGSNGLPDVHKMMLPTLIYETFQAAVSLELGRVYHVSVWSLRYEIGISILDMGLHDL